MSASATAPSRRHERGTRLNSHPLPVVNLLGFHAAQPAPATAQARNAGAQASILPGGTLSFSCVGTIGDRWRGTGRKPGFSCGF